MPSPDQATQDLAFRAHLLLNNPDGLAFVAAVDSRTNAPTNDRLIARKIDLSKTTLLIVRQSDEISVILDELPSCFTAAASM
ncbi:hypothetical protein [Acetobacter pasteurianus]|uniref:hypothetical protein n=1 Tax=Acetobacter pasteurianus TaxID=438 RepID=UPI000F56C033|nr:hypothetical protein [Acetobacter pasteurianus]